MMDAEASAPSSYKSPSCPQHQILHRKIPFPNLDRFIPNRSAMNLDYVRYVFVFAEASKKGKGKEMPNSGSPSAYRKQLAEIFDMNRNRIFAFKDKPRCVEAPFSEFSSPVKKAKPVKPRRNIPQGSERTLDAPGILEDYYLNILDWGCKNILAIALGGIVYLWNGSTNAVSELMSVDNENDHVTSVRWDPDGVNLAIGLSNSEVQLWETTKSVPLRTLRGGHRAGVGALDWNNHILTTGGVDGQIFNSDVRVRSHIIDTYRGHRYAVCGLKWSSSGQLASGGNDNLLHIWDISMASSNHPTRWLHRFENHTAAVKALAWSPFQTDLLVSGGGAADGCIKFWNTKTGAQLNSVNTGSQVCSLLWSKNERELLSSHGFTQNQFNSLEVPFND